MKRFFNLFYLFQMPIQFNLLGTELHILLMSIY